jgi:hypothetical protein
MLKLIRYKFINIGLHKREKKIDGNTKEELDIRWQCIIHSIAYREVLKEPFGRNI